MSWKKLAMSAEIRKSETAGNIYKLFISLKKTLENGGLKLLGAGEERLGCVQGYLLQRVRGIVVAEADVGV